MAQRIKTIRSKGEEAGNYMSPAPANSRAWWSLPTSICTEDIARQRWGCAGTSKLTLNNLLGTHPSIPLQLNFYLVSPRQMSLHGSSALADSKKSLLMGLIGLILPEEMNRTLQDPGTDSLCDLVQGTPLPLGLRAFMCRKELGQMVSEDPLTLNRH